MKIILTKDIDKLGNAGDVVRVKDGYGRNYLVPQGFALPANEKNIKELEFNRRMIQKKIDGEYGKARELGEKIAAVDISIAKKVGEEGKLFGSVTTREIADALKEKGYEIDHRHIILDGPIKKSGVYEVEVKLFRELKGKVKLWVVALEEDAAPEAEPAPETATGEKTATE
ncbi:MAG TPA: 50S ribosomal protein L9 [bacterium]|nr:50S ribosomal protein L9 [bacterium]